MSEDNGMKIVVVGPTQSGKTCLAAGLFSISTSDFTIEPANEDTRRYLSDLTITLRSSMDEQSGVWPEASDFGADKSLSLDFLRKGKMPIRVDFPEYSGETLQSDKFLGWANEHLRGLKGVVLLVNPGAEAFQKGDQRLFEDVIAQYKHVLSFMRNPVNESHHSLVALTVTAADRINGGDLMAAGKLTLFNECVRRLSNTLEASGFRWKRFDVTITGCLKDQNRPMLVEDSKNSASSPFLWLLDKLHWLPIRRRMYRRIRNCALALVGVAVLVAIGAYAWSVDAYIDLNKGMLERAIGNCRDGDYLFCINYALHKLRMKSGLFAGKAKHIADDLEPKILDMLERQVFEIGHNPEKCGSPSDCSRVDSMFALWSPEVAEYEHRFVRIKSIWEKNKDVWQDRYSAAHMKEMKFAEIIGTP